MDHVEAFPHQYQQAKSCDRQQCIAILNHVPAKMRMPETIDAYSFCHFMPRFTAFCGTDH